jgi:hypothetical protein
MVVALRAPDPESASANIEGAILVEKPLPALRRDHRTEAEVVLVLSAMAVLLHQR